MKKILALSTLSIITSALILGCGSDNDSSSSSNSSNSTDLETGYFIDSPVAGVEYNSSSGEAGVTDEYGRFKYKIGDKVLFHIGKLELGESVPSDDGLVTPKDLSDDNDTVVLIMRVLQALDADNNPANGITIPSDVIEKLSSSDINVTTIENLKTDNDILSLDTTLAEKLDEDYDGVIDVTPQVAEQHYEQSIQMWHNRPDNGHEEEQNNGYGNEEHGQNGNTNGHVGEEEHGQNGNGYAGEEEHNQNGDGNCTENENGSHGGSFDINSYPISTLNQDLKNALAYMGNEERLAHDVYTNVYNELLKNSGVAVNQLINIADRSEETHVKTVQSIVRKYNITSDDLTNVEVPVADSNISFEDMPSGVYGIPTIQNLYNVLYDKGIQSQKDALEVGCMVEVTDINDLNEYIELAKESNATDIVDGFTMLRDASYNHYWAFDKGLQNIGISTGCCSLGEIDGVNYCHSEYPTNEHGEESQGDNTQATQGQGQSQGYGQGNGQGRGHN